MVVDLRWADAMAIFGIARVFTPEQRLVAWPESMEPRQLAALQRPWGRGDTEGRGQCWKLRDELIAACAAGQLEFSPDQARAIAAELLACADVLNIARPGGAA